MFDAVRLGLHAFTPSLGYVFTTTLSLQSELCRSVSSFLRFIYIRQDVFSVVLLLRQSAVVHLVQVRFASIEIGAVVLYRERVFEVVDVVV